MAIHVESLQNLSQKYLRFLIDRDISLLNGFLSLNFLKRKRATNQLKLILKLPQLIYGFAPEAHIFTDYVVSNDNSDLVISPFQFDVFYTHHTNVMEFEKTTITINKLILENKNWKIDSILNATDESLLANLIKNKDKKDIIIGHF